MADDPRAAADHARRPPRARRADDWDARSVAEFLERARRPWPAPPTPSVRASLAFAWAGVRHAFSTQRNVRLQAAIGTIVVLVAGLLRVPAHDLTLLVVLSALVLCAELMNTAVERLLDYTAGTDFEPGVKRVKDLSAASVLVLCLGAAAVGAAILVPRLAAALARS
jgi:diacylglycerol kinase (ATP)